MTASSPPTRCKKRSCGPTPSGGRCATTTIPSDGSGASALNLLTDAHRRSARKRRAVARLAAEPVTVAAPREPDQLETLLASLPPQQRTAVALYYVDELSVAEVAAAMELAEGSVKSHLHDARRRLRAVVDREG